MIIGLVGKAGSGKSTVADILENAYNFEHLAFADELKWNVMSDFEINEYSVYNTRGKEIIDPRYNLTPREILQKVGSFYREFQENFWVNKVHKKISSRPTLDFCISDVRYPNELEMIKKEDGYIIKIERDDRVEITNSNHASEISLDNFLDFDYVIQNNSTSRDLEQSVSIMLKILGFKK